MRRWNLFRNKAWGKFWQGAKELTKPLNFNDLLALVRQLKRDWLEPLQTGQRLMKKGQ